MKWIILLALVTAITAGVGGYIFFASSGKPADIAADTLSERITQANEREANQRQQLPKPDLKPGMEHYPFEVYVETQLQTRSRSYQDAADYAEAYTNASVVYRKTNEVVWDNFLAFNVFYEVDHFAELNTFAEAVAHANGKERAFIYYRRNNAMIWTNFAELPGAHQIRGAEVIMQNPELPRGCEVTSLAMLLRYHGVNVTKMELAERITKDNTPYNRQGDCIYAGNPNTGFVGDMTNMQNFGFGVYHGPIYELLRYYKPSSAMDLTGCYFDALLQIIRMNRPVWIITNVSYRELPASAFETWMTPTGACSITRREHSVLVTGYDEERIYFNDPLVGECSAPRNDFISAWEQMGRQAVAVAE